MTTVDLTRIDQISAADIKPDWASRLTDGLHSLDRSANSEEATRWIVIAQAVRPGAGPGRGADRHLADLDYAAWHAHLAGVQRWAPGADGALGS